MERNFNNEHELRIFTPTSISGLVKWLFNNGLELRTFTPTSISGLVKS